jgi:hypothetical protein
MNLNDEMSDLGTMGGLAYAPSDDLISSLVSKTKRVRAVRQSSATIVGTVGALAIGIVAAQAYSAAKDDPAFRDRNVINNKDSLTPIELYRAKFGNDNPTRSYDSAVDLSSIVAKLKAAAAGGGSQPGAGAQQTPVKPAAPPADTAKPVKTTAPADPYAQCKLDHPDQGYKYYDCAKAKWIIKPGYYKDPADSKYYSCTEQPSYTGYTYDCVAGKYAPKDGYFLFGNGAVYQAVNWTDSATGASTLGNWSGTGNWGGWDQKAILVSPGSKSYNEYKYMGGDASWSGTTCTGVTKSKYGATLKLSCLPTWKVEQLGFNNGSPKISNDWVLLDTHLKWFDAGCTYADPANPPEGWTWDGSTWVEVAAP